MASKEEVRRINRNLIYRTIYGSEGISRQEIAAKTGLSIPTVIQNLNVLEESGLIATAGEFESTGGRKAKVIRCTSDAAFSIGIDITKNHLTAALVDIDGKIRSGGKREYLPYQDTEEYYDEVCRRITLLIEENHIDSGRVLGVGISLPSIIDPDGRRVVYGKILREPENIAERFEKRLPYPIEIMNDANAAGIAETWGTISEKPRFCLMLSNSVGGALIIRNQIYQGDHCRSAEIGHVKIVPDGKKCYCGQQGCVNAYVSANVLSDMTEGSLETFFEKLAQGEQPYAEHFARYLDYLAVTIINLRMLYDCDLIIGGYVGNYIDQYMGELESRLLRLNPYEGDEEFVKACRYKIEASAVGAGLPFIRRFIENI